LSWVIPSITVIETKPSGTVATTESLRRFYYVRLISLFEVSRLPEMSLIWIYGERFYWLIESADIVNHLVVKSINFMIYLIKLSFLENDDSSELF